ncbi:hypothetical protein VNO77_10810 [Canavalia gladiata]|uniref:Uncharacterized protein n=1 Tax=Canavalia gladiata TaxID=3824 RepID=A0AAN9QXC2_CANGL
MIYLLATSLKNKKRNIIDRHNKANLLFLLPSYERKYTSDLLFKDQTNKSEAIYLNKPVFHRRSKLNMFIKTA